MHFTGRPDKLKSGKKIKKSSKDDKSSEEDINSLGMAF